MLGVHTGTDKTSDDFRGFRVYEVTHLATDITYLVKGVYTGQEEAQLLPHLSLSNTSSSGQTYVGQN